MNIKFNDLYYIHKKIENKLTKIFRSSVKNSDFIGGNKVRKFENSFKKINQSKYCVSCANGSDALVIALKTLGVKPGDEIITTSLSWIATSAAITLVGAKVKFCDIEKDGFNIDVNSIEKKITKRTVGIIPVHLYGYPADMEKIIKIAKKYKLWVVEDCAQAHLAEINKKKVGNFGNIGTFSFFPGKNLGALGDAGCLVMNNKILAKRARLIANHGGKGLHVLEGLNSRMDSIQAAILNIKLGFLKQNTKKRISNAFEYYKKLNNFSKIKIPLFPKNIKPVYHQFTIRCKERDELKKFLKTNGIDTQIHYKQPLVSMMAYKYLKLNKKKYYRAISACKEILCLPISPDKTLNEIRHISKNIKKFYE